MILVKLMSLLSSSKWELLCFDYILTDLGLFIFSTSQMWDQYYSIHLSVIAYSYPLYPVILPVGLLVDLLYSWPRGLLVLFSDEKICSSLVYLTIHYWENFNHIWLTNYVGKQIAQVFSNIDSYELKVNLPSCKSYKLLGGMFSSEWNQCIGIQWIADRYIQSPKRTYTEYPG